jgi:LmbE family N-acetylglucosaminyl deacetylase
MRVSLIVLLLIHVVPAYKLGLAQAESRPSDDYKADLLLVVAHQDDDTAVAGYLARATLDEHRRVAVVYTTRGDNGPSAVSAKREIEARRALGSFGILNVWFLGAGSANTQDVLLALERWNHGSMLEQLVRMVRLTRPEVILTWLPASVAGENHADHQAAGVIATEAFDLAGDPAAFSEQLVEREGSDLMRGYKLEGLHPWQAQKLYYFSDAFDAERYWYGPAAVTASPYRANFLLKTGPAYSNKAISPSQHSYGYFAAKLTSYYLTQEGSLGVEALATGNLEGFEHPERYIFGKSVIGGEREGDIFAGVIHGTVAFARSPSVSTTAQEGLSLEFGGQWSFYPEFWRAHGLGHLSQLLPIPELAVDPGERLYIPLVLHNNTDEPHSVTLTVVLPEGWTAQINENSGTSHQTRVAMRDQVTIEAVLHPSERHLGWQEVTWKAEADGRPIGSQKLRVFVGEGGMPQ